MVIAYFLFYDLIFNCDIMVVLISQQDRILVLMVKMHEIYNW